MPRTTALFALLLLPLLADAAPVPKAGPKKIEDVFGQVADVSGVTCEMTRADELRVAVSKEFTVGTNQEHLIRPLVSKTVEGDFTLTIRVAHPPSKAADIAAVGPGAPTLSAGIALYAEGDPKKSLTLLHKHTKAGDDWKSSLSMSSRHERGGSGTGRQSKELEDKPLYLRLTRTGDQFMSETSADGKKWAAFGVHKVSGFGAVVVGPVAVHNTTADADAVFDEYKLETAAAKETKEEKK